MDEYFEVPYVHPTFYYGLPTIDATENALKTLDEDGALGPDMIPMRVLKRCAHAPTL